MNFIQSLIGVCLLTLPLTASAAESSRYENIPPLWSQKAQFDQIPSGWEKNAADALYREYSKSLSIIKYVEPVEVCGGKFKGFSLKKLNDNGYWNSTSFRLVCEKQGNVQAISAPHFSDITNISFMNSMNLSNLRCLDLQYTGLKSHHDMENLRQLDGLQYLLLGGIEGNEAERLKFSQAMPNCKILWDNDYYFKGNHIHLSSPQDVEKFFLPHFEKAAKLAKHVGRFSYPDKKIEQGRGIRFIPIEKECDNLTFQLVCQSNPNVQGIQTCCSNHITDFSYLTPSNAPDLRYLSLSNTKVKNFLHLATLTQLKELHLPRETMTESEVFTLSKALPTCEISYLNGHYLDGVFTPF